MTISNAENEAILSLLDSCGLWKKPYSLQRQRISSDGSWRRFFRVALETGATVMAIFPQNASPAAMAEARASWRIGSHLEAVGVPVPAMYGFDDGTGLLLCEDLGDYRLHDMVTARESFDNELIGMYKNVVRQLVHMQVVAGNGFNTDWCWDTKVYDRSLMLERESMYFVNALCRDTLNLEIDEPALMREFILLADRAAGIPASFFLFRDFQSRNVMIKDRRPRFIDFQGGRLGPLAYDLASLLIDPYAALPEAIQEELLHDYIVALKQESIAVNSKEFAHEFRILSLQRTLQVLGAFGFLTTHKAKTFFKPYIRPVLYSLQGLLAKPELVEYSGLRRLTDTCLQKVS